MPESEPRRLVFISQEQLDQMLLGKLAPDEVSILVHGFDRVFLVEAIRSAQRSRQGAELGSANLEAGGAAAAILLAAAACEAWFSEFLAVTSSLSTDDREELLALRTQRSALQKYKELFRLRAPDYELGASRPYQALGCLFKLRDHVAHRSARFATLNTWPERLQDCVRQGVIPITDAAPVDWSSVTFLHGVAAWAVRTANEWLCLVDDEVGLLPDDVSVEPAVLKVPDWLQP